MTSTHRVQALRNRRKAAGLSEVRGIWARPEDHARIKEQAFKINARAALTEDMKDFLAIAFPESEWSPK